MPGRAPMSMRLRILLSVFVCSCLAVPLLVVPLLQLVSWRVAVISVDPAAPAFELVRQQCAQDPEGWSVDNVSYVVHAYDGRTGLSANPSSPPINPTLWARVQAGQDDTVELRWLRGLGGTHLRRMADAGPCSVYQMRWRFGAQNDPLVRLGVLALLLGTLLVLPLGATALSVGPLIRRVERLAASAQGVGDARGYASIDHSGSDALGQVAKALDRSHARIRADAEQLEQRQRGLEEHLANVAHDVRTPLASLQLMLEELSDQLAGDPRQASPLSGLQDVAYLIGLTENLRQAARLEEGADPTAGAPRTDLSRLVQRVVGRFAVLGRHRGVQVRAGHPDQPVWVCCDAAMAEQVLANFVHNAVVHGGDGELVLVLLTVDQGRFVLQVLDEGPGVPPEQIPRLGERTFRSDEARTRAPGGSGLGLAIAAEVCQRAGWTLEFLARDGGGLEARVSGGLVV